MILTSSPQSVADSRRFDPGQHIPKLAECDRIFTYSECGYFCVVGYRGDSRTVHAHMDRAEELSSALTGHGYRLYGETLKPMTDAERRAERKASSAKYPYGR